MTTAELSEHLVSALSQAEPPLTVQDGLDEMATELLDARRSQVP
jgi:hypothetical protein